MIIGFFAAFAFHFFKKSNACRLMVINYCDFWKLGKGNFHFSYDFCEIFHIFHVKKCDTVAVKFSETGSNHGHPTQPIAQVNTKLVIGVFLRCVYISSLSSKNSKTLPRESSTPGLQAPLPEFCPCSGLINWVKKESEWKRCAYPGMPVVRDGEMVCWFHFSRWRGIFCITPIPESPKIEEFRVPSKYAHKHAYKHVYDRIQGITISVRRRNWAVSNAEPWIGHRPWAGGAAEVFPKKSLTWTGGGVT
jgi:hypothetical protein